MRPSSTLPLQRTSLIFLCVVCSISLMVIRLIAVQLVAGSSFREQADANRMYGVRLPKERGLFYDRYGQLLVINVPIFSSVTNPQQLFSSAIRVSREEGLRLLATDSARVMPGFERMYPLGEAAAHIVGYVSPATAEDVEKRHVAVQDVVGRYGLEKVLDEKLQGNAGKDVFEINALGRKMKKVTTIPASSGQEVFTTIDSFLTSVAARALAGKKGSVIIEDANTGDILALVNTPSFDPNVFTLKELDPAKRAIQQEKISGYFSDTSQPFFDRAISGLYPPGSVFKPVTAAAGLQTGVLSLEKTVRDEGVLKVDTYSFGNWYYSQYGRVEGDIALVRALARSNDIYFYKAAEWIGANTLAEFAAFFGFGKSTGSLLPGEQAGFVPTPEKKETERGERWYLGDTYHFGIGQGELLVTPLQVAQMTQTFAKRGSKCQPSLLRRDTTACEDVGVEEKNLIPVVQGMLEACSTTGTAFPFFSWNEQYRDVKSADPYAEVQNGAVACKTGTAEFGGVTELGKRKTHGWFTMIVGTDAVLQNQLQTLSPEEKITSTGILTSPTEFLQHATWLHLIKKHGFPKVITITVLVESDDTAPYKEGSKDAAPVAHEIMQWLAGK